MTSLQCSSSKSNDLTFIVCLKPAALECCSGCWLTGLHKAARVAQQSSACGQAALTLGRRCSYCGATTFLPFRASSPSLPVLLTGAKRAAVSSTFLARSFMTVINTSNDSVLCITTTFQSGEWDGAAGGRSAMTCFSLLPDSGVIWLSVSQIIVNRPVRIIAEVRTKCLDSTSPSIGFSHNRQNKLFFKLLYHKVCALSPIYPNQTGQFIP